MTDYKSRFILHLGDCLDWLPTLATDAYDCAITSPPYNIGENGMNEPKYGKGSDVLKQKDYAKLILTSLGQLIRVSKDVFYNIQLTSATKPLIPILLFRYRKYFKETIIWEKKSAQPAMEPGVLNSQFEFVFVFSKHNADKRKFYGEEWRGTNSNVIITPPNSGNKFANVHTAAFPELLPAHILNIVSTAKTVIDPFVGTGTTGVVAIKRGLHFTG